MLARGAKATSGWKPARPSPRIVEEAKSFSEAARQIGQADPDDVTEHLRRATKAFLAGDHVSARAVFDAILPPIACVDIDLGQHQLVEEVLGVDVRACVAQYPIVADRKRREYESLFASNVVSSRRPEAERPNSDTARSPGAPARAATDASLDEIAAAVIRASGGTAPSNQAVAVGSSPSPSGGQGATGLREGERSTPERTGPLSAAGPLHTLLEGTVIDTVLTNRLDGNGVAPVNCLVTNPATPPQAEPTREPSCW